MKIIVLLFCLLSTVNAFAQKQGQDRIDSLLSELAIAKEDQTKLNLYVAIMTTYNNFNREEGLKFEKPAMDLAVRMGSQRAVADVKNVLGRIYWRMGNFDTALTLHLEAKQIFENAKDKQKIAVTIRYIGQDYADDGNYSEALKHFNIAWNMYEELGDRENMGYLYNLLAWVFAKQGNYAEAARNDYLALRLFEEMGDKKNIAMAMSDIAEHYVQFGNYSDALKYYEKSREILREKGDRINLGYNHNMVGKVYQLMGNFPESLRNHEAALSLGNEVKDPNIMAIAHNGIAEVYKIKKEYPKALDHYLSSAELFKKGSNRSDLARSYCYVGDCYRIGSNYSLAKAYYDSAFVLSTVLDSKALLAEYYRGAELLDSVRGNWRDAYLNHSRYERNRDSIFNQENVKKMVQLKLEHDFDKKEAAVKAEQEEKDIRQEKQFFSLVVIASLIFVLAMVLYRNQKREAKINLELKQKSESLEEENREKTSILYIVSHDLKAPFNKIKGLADLMYRTEDLTKTEKELYLNHVQTSIEQGNYLITKLLEAQTVYDETESPSLQPTDLVQFIHDFRMASNELLLKKQQHFHADIQLPSHDVLIDQQMITRILDNLVSNASKFSETGTSIYLRVWPEGEFLNISVRDEGPGISEEDQKKMFRKFQKLSAQPTAGESSTGLGLSIAKTIIEKLNGSIHVTSKLGEGTEVVISIPA